MTAANEDYAPTVPYSCTVCGRTYRTTDVNVDTNPMLQPGYVCEKCRHAQPLRAHECAVYLPLGSWERGRQVEREQNHSKELRRRLIVHAHRSGEDCDPCCEIHDYTAADDGKA